MPRLLALAIEKGYHDSPIAGVRTRIAPKWLSALPIPPKITHVPIHPCLHAYIKHTPRRRLTRCCEEWLFEDSWSRCADVAADGDADPPGAYTYASLCDTLSPPMPPRLGMGVRI